MKNFNRKPQCGKLNVHKSQLNTKRNIGFNFHKIDQFDEMNVFNE